MPETEVVIYQEQPGEVPLLCWLDGLPVKVRDKCIDKVERLEERGYDLRRPNCDYLDQGIYELRARQGKVRYRILYAFIGENAALLSHGCTKKKAVPKREINKALMNLHKYTENPKAHTYIGEL